MFRILTILCLLTLSLTMPQPALAQTVDDARAAGKAGNDAEAVRILRLLNDQGDIEAKILLGYMTQEGRGVKQDLDAALAYYQQAGRAGEPNGWYYAAFMFLSGPREIYNSGTFHSYIERAAKGDLPAALYHLGINHLAGRGTDMDESKAMRPFSAAYTKHRVQIAGIEMANMLVRGTAVPQDIPRAKQILTAVANHPNATQSEKDSANSRLRELARDTPTKSWPILFDIRPYFEPREGETVSEAQSRGMKERELLSQLTKPKIGPKFCAPGAPEFGTIVHGHARGFDVLPAALSFETEVDFRSGSIRRVSFRHAAPKSLVDDLRKTGTDTIGTMRIRQGNGDLLEGADWPFVWKSGLTSMAITSTERLDGACPYRADDGLGITKEACSTAAKQSLATLIHAIEQDQGPFSVEFTEKFGGEGDVVWSQPLSIMPWSAYSAALQEYERGVRGHFHMPSCEAATNVAARPPVTAPKPAPVTVQAKPKIPAAPANVPDGPQLPNK